MDGHHNDTMLGAFHYKTGEAEVTHAAPGHLATDNCNVEVSSIHHHWCDGELWSGWVGVLFLSSNKECEGEGTMIFRRKDTGLCVSDKYGMDYTRAAGADAYDKVPPLLAHPDPLTLG